MVSNGFHLSLPQTYMLAPAHIAALPQIARVCQLADIFGGSAGGCHNGPAFSVCVCVFFFIGLSPHTYMQPDEDIYDIGTS